ncbi:MAG: histidinol dehydrogenase [bacterium]|nr:histidinol dehydrogenase [bacterium]
MENIEQNVRDILKNVKINGDDALIAYSQKFDKVKILKKNLLLDVFSFKPFLKAIPSELLASLEQAKKNIFDYHQAQFENILSSSLTFNVKNGAHIHEKITTIERVGIYVPGGKFSYPSSVLMTVLPAKASGVKEIIVATPMKNLTDVVKAALFLAGVDKVLVVGGAQAVAAMAYGTETIDKVDMIVGPGNAYVTEAKRQVFGSVGIDMLAGPSDVTIFANKDIPTDWIVADLHAQAEHDPMSRATLISIDLQLIDAVRANILPQFLAQIFFIKQNNILECTHFINKVAPEHLEILTLDKSFAEEILSHINHAGAVFVGGRTTVAMGDYYLGPSHTLPTGSRAKFSSGLSVHTFIKRIAVMTANAIFVEKETENIANIADSEGLKFHADSLRSRLSKKI